MGDLTAANVTVAIVFKDMARKTRLNVCTITFGNGALTYPTNGVPMPDKKIFGMGRFGYLVVLGQNLPGFKYEFDPTLHTMRILQVPAIGAGGEAAQPLDESVTAPAATVLTCLALGI